VDSGGSLRYRALACDYDGTLAESGRVDPRTVEALERARQSGRRLLLVTGRRLADLFLVFPQTGLFDAIVVENGAVLHLPQGPETRLLAPPPAPELLATLRARGVEPLVAGHAIVASWEPWQHVVLEVIRQLGMELQVVFNKGAVMVLPTGINKATGLRAGLAELGLSPRNVVGVGDAENDHAFLAACECGVAVANALPTVRERADWVTSGAAGAGVAELIDDLLATDLRALEPRLVRHHVPLGRTRGGEDLTLPGFGANLLVAGTSGSGKSTFATGLLERFLEREAQVVIVDPEGDYQALDGLVALGSGDRPPGIDEVLDLIAEPDQSAAVNLLGVRLEDRPELFRSLFLRLQELRVRTGRPHWILVDEAHHLLPRDHAPGADLLPPDLQGLLWITVHPEHLAPAVLATADHVVAIGKTPARTLDAVANRLGLPPPGDAAQELAVGDAILWRPRLGAPIQFGWLPPRAERRRHTRKYAEGNLGSDRSFYFRGPDGRLKLRAPNLATFLALADGLDDETWLHHLERGDYSRWFGESIKDAELAEEARRIEAGHASPAESRARIREAIARRYTLPA
jgi:HAD superfamily hydrolase (TIGR01484 family)